MASLPFPDTGTRRVELNSGKPAVNARAYLYADEDLTVAAEVYLDIDGVKGALIAPDEEGRVSQLLDAYGRQLDFWGPEDGTDRLWIMVGGVKSKVDADYNARIDAVSVRVAALEGESAADPTLLHKAGAENVTGVKTFDVSPIVPTPAGGTEATPKGYVDTAISGEASARVSGDAAAVSTAAGDATAKANAAQTAATAHAVQRGNHTGTQAMSTIVGLGASLDGKADLVDGVVPTSQIPPSSSTFLGEVASEAAMLALEGERNDICKRTDTDPDTTWLLVADDPTLIGSWTQLSSAGAVSSVNGQSGTIVLGPSDVGADPSGSAAAAQAAAVLRSAHTGTQSADTLTDGATNKAFLATERTKLAGVATAATANSSDVQLRDRATHTGAQATSTITGLDVALAGKAPLASPAFTGTPTGITKAHVGLGSADNTSDANKPVSTATATALAGKAARLTTTTTKTSAYVAAANELVPCDATSAAFAVSLPSATTAGIGAVVVVRKIDSGTNGITVQRAGSDTINAAATSVTLTLTDEAMTFTSDGVSKWAVTAGQKSLATLDARYSLRGEAYIDAADFAGVDPTGATISTAGLRLAIAAVESSTAATRNLLIPRGVYKTDDTLTIEGTTGVHVSAYGARILAGVGAGVAAIELKTTPPNYTGGNRTMIDGLQVGSSNLGVGVGIHVNVAQQWYLHNVLVEHFDTGLKIGDSYYGALGGNTSFYGNTISVDIVSEEVNTLRFYNTKMSAASHLPGATTTGIRSVAMMNAVKFDGVIVEGYDYGFVYARQTFGTGVFSLDGIYFEAITTCAIDFSQKADTASCIVEMTNLHFNEQGKAAWIKLGAGGAYTFTKSNFKTNRILINNVGSQRTSLNTDLPISQIDFVQTQGTTASDGLVQLNGDTVQFIDGNVYRYNTQGDYNVFPLGKTHLPSLVDARPIMAISPFDPNSVGRFYPLLTVNHRDGVWESGGVVLKSPGGNYFRLTVDDAGTVTTQDVTASKRMFAPSLSSYPAVEIGRREVRGSTYTVVAEGASIHVRELNNRKVTKTAGVILDANTSTRAFGTTLQAIATTPGASFFSPYFWDTDIEFFYCWQSSYWAWCGSNNAEATNLRAIGTLAQRPTTPASAFMRYYATDNTTRYAWNGSAWS